MLRLNELFNDSIDFNGNTYTLNMALSNVLTALNAAGDTQMTIADRIRTFVYLIVNEDTSQLAIDDLNSLSKIISDKHINPRHAQQVEYDIEGNPMPENDVVRDISFEYDADYIYAAFMQTYKIDLIDQQDALHWLKFVALLNALPEDTMLRQIRQIRTEKIEDVKDKDSRKQLRKQKRIWRLPDSDDEEEGGETFG